MNFNEIIRNEREKADFSQEKLAEILGVSRVTISKWERGVIKPSRENIERFEEFFGVRLFSENELLDKNVFAIGTTHIIADFKLAKINLMFEKLDLGLKTEVKAYDAVKLNRLLVNDRINILIDYFPQINFDDDRFIFKAIGKFNTCFACNKNLYEKVKKIKKLEDLNAFKLIIPGSSRRRQLLDNFLKEKNINLDSNSIAHNTKYMADMVVNGDYIGYFIEEQIEYYGLKKLYLEDELPINPIGIVYLKKCSEETKKYVDLICKYF